MSESPGPNGMSLPDELSAAASEGAVGDLQGGYETRRMRRSREKLMRDLKAVASDARLLMSEAAQTSSESLAGVRARIENQLSGTRESVRRARLAIRERADRATVATGDYMKENPWKSVGLIAVAGMLLGLLLVRAWNSSQGARRGSKE